MMVLPRLLELSLLHHFQEMDLDLTGVSAGSTDNIQTATVANFLDGVTISGVTTANNNIQIQSDDSTPEDLISTVSLAMLITVPGTCQL